MKSNEMFGERPDTEERKLDAEVWRTFIVGISAADASDKWRQFVATAESTSTCASCAQVLDCTELV